MCSTCTHYVYTTSRALPSPSASCFSIVAQINSHEFLTILGVGESVNCE